MKRKRIPAAEPVLSPEILEKAKRSAHPDTKAPKRGKCVVCGADCPVTASEQLCWVCRRLKISAWHEVEQQMPAQE